VLVFIGVIIHHLDFGCSDDYFPEGMCYQGVLDRAHKAYLHFTDFHSFNFCVVMSALADINLSGTIKCFS
jgi:hypothetical protein